MEENKVTQSEEHKVTASEECPECEVCECEVEEVAKQETDWKDCYVRLAADFENYRKRTQKEFDDVRRREREKVIMHFLDVYDNALRAVDALPEKSGGWYEGYTALLAQMDKVLAGYDVKILKSLGEKFDPKYHDAMATLPNPEMEDGTIMHVERSGFVYANGECLRVARVVVVKNA